MAFPTGPGELEGQYGTDTAFRCRTYGNVYGMERTTVYLTATQRRALARTARLTGRSEAELIRAGVDAVTAGHRATEPTIPLFESGRSDLATRSGELLEGFGEQ